MSKTKLQATAKKFYQSKTLWFFGTLVLACSVKLLTGEDLGTGVRDQSASIAEGLSVAAILLRFVTSQSVEGVPSVPGS